MNYAEWIAAYVERTPNLYGKCVSATLEMVEVFPELKRIAGWADEVEHFWCVTPTGEIVDPTAAQFAGPGGIEYREFKPGDEVRVGRCMNCGDSIYRAVPALDDPSYATSICSDECEEEAAAELRARDPRRDQGLKPGAYTGRVSKISEHEDGSFRASFEITGETTYTPGKTMKRFVRDESEDSDE